MGCISSTSDGACDCWEGGGGTREGAEEVAGGRADADGSSRADEEAPAVDSEVTSGRWLSSCGALSAFVADVSFDGVRLFETVFVAVFDSAVGREEAA